MKRYLNINTGEIDTLGLNAFLDKVIPANGGTVKDDILAGKEVTLLARFSIYIDLIKGVKQFAIPDYGIKQKRELFLIMCMLNIRVNWLMARNGVL